MTPRNKRGLDSPIEGERLEELKQIIEDIAGTRDSGLAKIAIMRARRNDWRALATRIRNGKSLGEGQILVADYLETDSKHKKGKTGRPVDFVGGRRSFKIAIDVGAYGQKKLNKQIKYDVGKKYGCSDRTVINAVERYGPDAIIFNQTILRVANSFKPSEGDNEWIQKALRDLLTQDDDAIDLIRCAIRWNSEEDAHSIMMCCLLSLAQISPT